MADFKKLLTKFLLASEQDVLSWFARLKDAYSPKDGSYVYVPGKREDRLLLVAHADTASGVVPDLEWVGDVCTVRGALEHEYYHDSYVGKHVECLGADDRAGCAMLWSLYDGKHSILITTGEESGCVGAKKAVDQIGVELEKHSFAVEVDRRGNRHACFYDISTNAFEKHILALLEAHDLEKAKWNRYGGLSTDIVKICGSLRICGVNLSAGYTGEHTSSEVLFLHAWLNTRAALRRILRLEKHSPFRLAKVAVVHVSAGSSANVRKVSTTASGKATIVVLDNGAKLTLPSGELSKRQAKKLMRKVRTLAQKGKVSQEEATKLCEQIADARDNPPRPSEPTSALLQKGGTVDIWGRCWHWCNGCRARWYHRKATVPTLKETSEKPPCALFYSCMCAECSPQIVPRMLEGQAWGIEGALRETEPTARGEVKVTTVCQHYCRFCHSSWSHRRRGMRCSLPIYESCCPGHSLETYQKVEKMEKEAEVPSWASALKMASFDPRDASSTKSEEQEGTQLEFND